MRAGNDYVDEKLASCQLHLQTGLGAERTVIEGDVKSEKLPEKRSAWFALDSSSRDFQNAASLCGRAMRTDGVLHCCNLSVTLRLG
jgi:hypothetical protein